MLIEKNALVTLRCRVHDGQGQLIDDGSAEETYRYGCGMLLEGVERAIAGARAGARLAVELSPEQAYGPYRSELVFEATNDVLPPGLILAPGMRLRSTGGPFPLKVIALTERGATLDGNHPLAGKRLHFEIEIVNVQRGAAGCATADCSMRCTGRCAA